MAIEHLSMRQAVAEIRLQLEEFAAKRGIGLSVADAAAAAGIPAERGERFEIAVSTLLAVLKTETAPAHTDAANLEGNHS